MDLIKELEYRNFIQDKTPGIDTFFSSTKSISFYVGFDPTSDSLHVGSLVPLLLMKLLQQKGHKPYVLIGGATGMIGDPSGKSEERKFLDFETLNHNQECIKKQIENFLDFNSNSTNKAVIVNNYDWFSGLSFLEFTRNIGKLITVNYMMSKESVKKRIESEQGISFTEFTYQLIQAYDFLHLFEHHKCLMQIGGSDQWGNITTGIELIRKKTGKEAYAFTTPLLKKSEGGKFGKTEKGNIWLDKKKTSPYLFYQFWLNSSDKDSKEWVKIFTSLPKKTIDEIILQHDEASELRLLQKSLAKEITNLVHGKESLDGAIEVSELLFSDDNPESLTKLSKESFNEILSLVPHKVLEKSFFYNTETEITSLLTSAKIFGSNGEARRMIQNGGVYVNKLKIASGTQSVKDFQLLHSKYLIIQRGKKNFFLIEFC